MDKVIICIVLLVLIIGTVCAVGFFAPINQFIPFAITLNRPELRPFRDALIRGNEWAYFCSPLTAHLGLPATGGDCAFGLRALSEQAKSGEPAFYKVYSEEERAADPTLENVGIYFLRASGNEKKPYVAMIAGGGFTSVCTLWESLPVSASFQEMGYSSFCIQYRTGTEFGKIPPIEQLMGDVAACIKYINEHAEQFGVLTEDYLIGGFSAGSKTASMWANENIGYGSYGLPKPAAVCLIYGANKDYICDGYNVPTFCRYCLHDQYYENNSIFEELEVRLGENDIPNDFKCVDAKHGFGLGSGSEAEGWTKEAEIFWKAMRSNNESY